MNMHGIVVAQVPVGDILPIIREDLGLSVCPKKSFTGKLKLTYSKLFFCAEKHTVGN